MINSVWKKMTGASVAAIALGSLALGSAAGAAPTLVLVSGPPPPGVRAGVPQTALEFVHQDSATGAPSVGTPVHFDVLSGPNVGQHAIGTSTASGAVVWHWNTDAAKPDGGVDSVRMWIDTNNDNIPQASEPQDTRNFVTLPALNEPPTADNVNAQVPQDTPTFITLAGSDPEGGFVGYAIVDGPSHGTLPDVVTGPTVKYTPNAGYVGADSFTYKVRDANGSTAQGTVTIDVQAKASTQTATCDGSEATIVVPFGQRLAFGTSHDDVIVAEGNNTTIYGLGGNDKICANGGNNHVYGGPGDDRIFLGNGNNVVYGGDGADHIVAGNGSNWIFGGNNSDTIIVGNGNNRVFAGSGADSVEAGTGVNVISGGDGDDHLSALNPASLLWGGNGTDIFDRAGKITQG